MPERLTHGKYNDSFPSRRRLRRRRGTAAASLKLTPILVLACFTALFDASSRSRVDAFVPHLTTRILKRGSFLASTKSTPSWVLPPEDVHPVIRLKAGTDKEKIVNMFGLWIAFASVITTPLWLLSMKILTAIYKVAPDFDSDRSIYDTTGKLWSKAFLSLTNSYPEVTGDTDRLEDRNGGACLYVANHASWLDIPVLCTVLDPVFKFIAKGELKKVPCIGDQLTGGKHILIDRDDRRSQLRTFKEGLGFLRGGIPVMAFPEGKRSKDGRLMEFKSGLFSMALKTKVPIIPITISNTHAIMPSNALLPVQSGKGKLNVHVHKPVDVEGKTELEVIALVREAIISKLPMDQRPLDSDGGEDANIDQQKELQRTS